LKLQFIITAIGFLVIAWLVWKSWTYPPRNLSPDSHAIGPADTLPKIRGNGRFSVEVVGESFHADSFNALIRQLRPDDLGGEWFGMATLTLDDGNAHDKNAVAVHILGRQVGHLGRDFAVEFRNALKRDGLQKFQEFGVDARLYWGGDDARHSVSLDLPET